MSKFYFKTGRGEGLTIEEAVGQALAAAQPGGPYDVLEVKAALLQRIHWLMPDQAELRERVVMTLLATRGASSCSTTDTLASAERLVEFINTGQRTD